MKQKNTKITPDENNLFLEFTKDVKPLHLQNEPIKILSPVTLTKSPTKIKLIQFISQNDGKYIGAHIDGFDKRLWKKLNTGKINHIFQLDLHGFTADSARVHLVQNLENMHAQQRSCGIIIFGQGHHSSNGIGVLRQMVPNWLIEPPLSQYVLAFCSAQLKHGGFGAIYVLLRNKKK